MLQFCARQFEDVSGQGGGILQRTAAAKSVISAVVTHSTEWDKICGVAPLVPAQGQRILCATDGPAAVLCCGCDITPCDWKTPGVYLGYTPNAILMPAEWAHRVGCAGCCLSSCELPGEASFPCASQLPSLVFTLWIIFFKQFLPCSVYPFFQAATSPLHHQNLPDLSQERMASVQPFHPWYSVWEVLWDLDLSSPQESKKAHFYNFWLLLPRAGMWHWCGSATPRGTWWGSAPLTPRVTRLRLFPFYPHPQPPVDTLWRHWHLSTAPQRLPSAAPSSAFPTHCSLPGRIRHHLLLFHPSKWKEAGKCHLTWAEHILTFSWPSLSALLVPYLQYSREATNTAIYLGHRIKGFSFYES